MNLSMIKKNVLNKHWTNFLSKEEEVDRFTDQYEVQTFQNSVENKLNQFAKTNSREFGWFQEATQSLKRDSALQCRLEREIVLCKALCPVQECVGHSV